MKFSRKSNNTQVHKDNQLQDETGVKEEAEDNRSNGSSREENKNESEESKCGRESPKKMGSKTTTEQILNVDNTIKLNKNG